MSELEQKMVEDGKIRFQGKVQKAIKNRYETILPGQNALVKKSIILVTCKIEAFIKEACEGKATKGARIALTLQDFLPDVLAVIVSKFLMNQLHLEESLTTVAIELSRALDMERHLQTLANEHQRYYDFMTRNLHKAIVNPQLIQTIIIRKAREKGIKLSEERKTAGHLEIGQKLIELFAKATGFIAIEKQWNPKASHSQYRIVPDKEVLSFIKRIDAQMELMSPVFGPILHKPQPWSGMAEGGFETLPLTMIKNRTSRLEEYYKDHNMSEVYKALNALQDTPYTINRQVYDVAHTLWEERRLAIAGLPEHYDKRKHERPSKEDPPNTPRGTFQKRKNRELLGKNIACALTLQMAKEYLHQDAFYFVHTLDFRGRAYPVTSHLSPQGNDLNKGILTFAASQGRPLGAGGAQWLAIHGANCCGINKVSLLERVAWVKKHQARILQVARDPYQDYWWTEVKEPFQFLAFCFAWAGYCREGESYVCALPIPVDGSSNALQHFAAILRDKALGARVNMVPFMNQPQDIYQEICDKLLLKAHKDAEAYKILEEEAKKPRTFESQTLESPTPEPKSLDTLTLESPTLEPKKEKIEKQKVKEAAAEYLKRRRLAVAQHWTTRLNRSLVKQPIMTYYYGATYDGMWDQVSKAIKEQKLVFPKHKKDKEGKEKSTLDDCIDWLVSSIREIIPQEIPVVEEVMQFLQKVAKECCAQNKPVIWTTPSGFKVVLDNVEMKSLRVRTELFGDIIKLNYVKASEPLKYDLQKQMSSISAHFIHSLDASAMISCVNESLEQGITSFRMIHDGFATVPAHMDAFSRCIRTSFIRMYIKHHVLKQFVEEACGQNHLLLDSLPLRGALDLEALIDTEYFFA